MATSQFVSTALTGFTSHCPVQYLESVVGFEISSFRPWLSITRARGSLKTVLHQQIVGTYSLQLSFVRFFSFLHLHTEPNPGTSLHMYVAAVSKNLRHAFPSNRPGCMAITDDDVTGQTGRLRHSIFAFYGEFFSGLNLKFRSQGVWELHPSWLITSFKSLPTRANFWR